MYESFALEQWVSAGTGMFAREFIQQFPDLPVVEEKELTNEQQAEKFIEKIQRHYRLSLSARNND